METILSSAIALAVTLFFVLRHVRTMPAAKPAARPVRRKPGSGQPGAATAARRPDESQFFR